jgi:hypothetical protein
MEREDGGDDRQARFTDAKRLSRTLGAGLTTVKRS